jgi:hypothetical protein
MLANALVKEKYTATALIKERYTSTEVVVIG